MAKIQKLVKAGARPHPAPVHSLQCRKEPPELRQATGHTWISGREVWAVPCHGAAECMAVQNGAEGDCNYVSVEYTLQH